MTTLHSFHRNRCRRTQVLQGQRLSKDLGRRAVAQDSLGFQAFGHGSLEHRLQTLHDVPHALVVNRPAVVGLQDREQLLPHATDGPVHADGRLVSAIDDVHLAVLRPGGEHA